MAKAPVYYTPEVAERICLRLAQGESLRSICRDKEMPSRRVIVEWVLTKPEFKEKYDQARDIQIELMADEILDIADDSARDIRDDGTIDHEAINRARLKVDTRKWLLAKLRPKKYGDKIAQEVTGKDGQPLVNVDMEAIARWLAFETSKPKTE